MPGAEGHGLNNNDGTGLADQLDGVAAPVLTNDSIFWPVDEALQLLGATQLLEHYDDVVNTIDGTAGAAALTGTEVADQIDGLAGDDSILGGKGDDFIFGGDGQTIWPGSKARTRWMAGPGMTGRMAVGAGMI